jgi:hypothetical protein
MEPGDTARDAAMARLGFGGRGIRQHHAVPYRNEGSRGGKSNNAHRSGRRQHLVDSL